MLNPTPPAPCKLSHHTHLDEKRPQSALYPLNGSSSRLSSASTSLPGERAFYARKIVVATSATPQPPSPRIPYSPTSSTSPFHRKRPNTAREDLSQFKNMMPTPPVKAHTRPVTARTNRPPFQGNDVLRIGDLGDKLSEELIFDENEELKITSATSSRPLMPPSPLEHRKRKPPLEKRLPPDRPLSISHERLAGTNKHKPNPVYCLA